MHSLTEIVVILIEIPLQFVAEGSTALIQIMAGCLQATGPYLNQCLPSSATPYDVSESRCIHLYNMLIESHANHFHKLLPG